MVRWLFLVAIASGVVLRVAAFARVRPLWEDEVFLALNILSKSFVGLMGPLDSMQMSPLGFLWIEWIATRLLGSGELALRALPLVAGVAALIGFSTLARRILDPGAALVATVLASVSPLLIHYSTEVKSYAFDALTATVLMHTTLDAEQDDARTRRGVGVHWVIAAVFASLFSTAAPFIVGGCAGALVARNRFRLDRYSQNVLGACLPAAILFVVQLLTVYNAPLITILFS